MDNPNCNNCIRRKHCFIRDFKVLSCEDYKPEIKAEHSGKESNDANSETI